jgi:hypothetical protein
MDIGLKRTAEDGGAVVDANFFATALAMDAGPYNNLQALHLGAYTLAKCEQPIWQALGLSSDPGVEYVVYSTVTTAFDGGQPTKIEGLWAV